MHPIRCDLFCVGPRGAKSEQRRIDRPFVSRLKRHRGPAPPRPRMPVRIQRVCPGVWGQSPHMRREAPPLLLESTS
jgi:hypothetical protein